LRQFWISKLLEPKIQNIYFFSTILWQIIFYSITAILYPLKFTMTRVWISDLGNPIKYQPFGVDSYLIFNFGIFITGFLFFGHFNYLYHNLKFRYRISKIIVFVFLGSGAMGYWGISIFTDNIQPYHDFSAMFAFFGFNFGYQALDYYWIVKTIQNMHNDSSYKSKFFLLMNFAGLFFMTVCVTYFLINYGLDNYSGLAIWEWLAALSILSNMITTFIILQFTDYSKKKSADIDKPR
jgi:hypothetical membrane protein